MLPMMQRLRNACVDSGRFVAASPCSSDYSNGNGR